MIFTVPSSWGSPLREFNQCHDAKGKFCATGAVNPAAHAFKAGTENPMAGLKDDQHLRVFLYHAKTDTLPAHRDTVTIGRLVNRHIPNDGLPDKLLHAPTLAAVRGKNDPVSYDEALRGMVQGPGPGFKYGLITIYGTGYGGDKYDKVLSVLQAFISGGADLKTSVYLPADWGPNNLSSLSLIASQWGLSVPGQRRRRKKQAMAA